MTRLLAVEDEKALNGITCDTLRDAGYDVTGCLNDNRAFDAVTGRRTAPTVERLVGLIDDVRRKARALPR
ncbi:DNA-binding response regulator [Bifidobacterium ramosum]|uniref:DNA-binding response regulator n=1 Tax=Bifidobacterium ramosum TaxID=1798158 RepID=A0A6L4WY63_9BIFI|nr:hypothetical protein [Bifidobacterium ramosum]KAB8287010.1 DNA-binding response regulator [Bifidobacterium ramosum]NEG72483.1 hypothetical protein [Bifidobacterium ramosum]